MARREIRKIGASIASLVLAVACFGCLAACTSGASSEGDPIVARTDTSKGVAATFNGKSIGEGAVTAYIEYQRSADGLEEDADWAEWLDAEGETPKTYRESVIDDYINTELMLDAAEELNVEVTDEEIDEYKLDEWGELSDEEWQGHLDRLGITDERYRDIAKNALIRRKVMEVVSPDGSQTWYQYVTELRDQADIKINDMPSGLSYDIDIESFVGSSDDE